MRLRTRLAVAASIVLALSMSCGAHAAPPEDLNSVLHRLDAAAANFHSTAADFVFDTEQVNPFPDTDILKGTAYYEHDGANFKMAAHISVANSHPVTRVYTLVGGQLTFYDKGANQVTRITKAHDYASYLMLGFGASGKELADKWEMKYLGSETIEGVKTEKLELVAKDPDVHKNLAKVTIWIDADRAVSLRQRFDQNANTYRICTYSHFKTNQSLPADAFTFKTDPNPTYMNQ